MDEVVAEDLEVAPPGVGADVGVPGGVLHRAVVRPAGVGLVLQVDAVPQVPEIARRTVVTVIETNRHMVFSRLEDLGWAEFDLGSYAVCQILPRQMGFWQKWLCKMGEQPNRSPQDDGTLCTLMVSSFSNLVK